MSLRKNDIVQVISGNDRGHSGKILRVEWERERVIVEGGNFVWKHRRRRQ